MANSRLADSWHQSPSRCSLLLRSGPKGLRRGRTCPSLLLTEDFSKDMTGLAFSPDGHWLAGIVADKTVRIWDVAHAGAIRMRRMLLGYSGAIGNDGLGTSLAFTPDGRELLVAVEEPQGAAIRIYRTSEFAERDHLVESVLCHRERRRGDGSLFGRPLHGLGRCRPDRPSLGTGRAGESSAKTARTTRRAHSRFWRPSSWPMSGWRSY